MRRRRSTNSQLPTGPMIRTLRLIAKGRAVPVVGFTGTVRGFALVLAGLTARKLIEPGDTVDGVQIYRLTAAGHAAIQRSRTVRS